MAHHRVGLARTLPSELDTHAALDEVEVFGRDGSPLPSHTTARENAMLGYALALTHAPAKMTAAHLQPMRDAGLSDAEILDANQVIAYFAYVNRMVDGLGVELESPQGESL